MPNGKNVLAFVFAFVLSFMGIAGAHAQGRKDSTFRGPIVSATAAKDDAHKKAGLLGWISLKDAGPGIRVFIKEKTKLEKMVGKDRRPATFDDLKKGATVELTYVLHDGQPSAGPTLADAKTVLILTDAK
jgi:hypothetical protein